MRSIAGRFEPLQSNDHETAAAVFARRPGAVEMMVDARTDRLDEQPHRLALDIDESLHPQHVLGLGGFGHLAGEIGGLGDRRQLDDETVEIVVLVIEGAVVMGLAVLDVVLDGKAEAEQHRRIDLALAGRHDLAPHATDVPRRSRRRVRGRRHP